RKLAKDASLKKVPLTMFGEPGGPPDYELARDADVTVMMWKEHKVKVNLGYKGELTDTDIQTILADIPKILGDSAQWPSCRGAIPNTTDPTEIPARPGLVARVVPFSSP